MRFRGHESFFLRRGWLHKGLKNINDIPDLFTNKEKNPSDILGLGSNMVRALKYWLIAFDLIKEKYDKGKKNYILTDLAKVFFENDPYFEENGSLWCLQYKLACNKKDATAWYYFFNNFNISEFTKDDYIRQLNKYIKNIDSDKNIALSSLEGDFDCIINTYISRKKLNPDKVHPENNIDSPFGDLNLIEIINKKDKIYKKNFIKIDDIHPLIILAIIVDNKEDKDELKISDLLTNECNVGKVFNLDIINLINILYVLQDLKYIKVVRTAGLDVVKIETEMNFFDCVKKYYESFNNVDRREISAEN